MQVIAAKSCIPTRRAGELTRANCRVSRLGSNKRERHETLARLRKRRHINLCNWRTRAMPFIARVNIARSPACWWKWWSVRAIKKTLTTARPPAPMGMQLKRTALTPMPEQRSLVPHSFQSKFCLRISKNWHPMNCSRINKVSLLSNEMKEYKVYLKNHFLSNYSYNIM